MSANIAKVTRIFLGCFKLARKILVTFAIFAIFADILDPFLASLLSKSGILLNLLFCDICEHFGPLLGSLLSKSGILLNLLFLRFLRYLSWVF